MVMGPFPTNPVRIDSQGNHVEDPVVMKRDDGEMSVQCACGWRYALPERSQFALPTVVMNQWERHWKVAHAHS